MRKSWSVIMGSLLILALISQSESLAAALYPGNKEFNADFSFNQLNRMYFNDSTMVYAIEEFYGSTESPEHEALEVHSSSDPAFDYMAQSPYYTVYFKGADMKLVVGGTWITLSVIDQELGEVQGESTTPADNTLNVQDVFDSVDLAYEVTTSVLQETLTLETEKEFSEIIYEIAWDGIEPEYGEDGSIVFRDDTGKDILKINAPFMKDDNGSLSTGISMI